MKAFLEEDVPHGDITTTVAIRGDALATAHIIAEEELVFAGSHLVTNFFARRVSVDLGQKDGDMVASGAVMGKISGPAQDILTGERVLLNLLQRLCGIATLTRKFVERISGTGVKLLDTRKTSPGLRRFEKYAVAIGGGYNHRLNLSSAILFKDNHVKMMDNLGASVVRARKEFPQVVIELEVESESEVEAGLDAGVDALLLDNMPPQAVATIANRVKTSFGERAPFLEVSGGITLDTIAAYASADVDGISVGALTHSAASKSIRLDFI